VVKENKEREERRRRRTREERRRRDCGAWQGGFFLSFLGKIPCLLILFFLLFSPCSFPFSEEAEMMTQDEGGTGVVGGKLRKGIKEIKNGRN